jgi:hypothetical protein
MREDGTAGKKIMVKVFVVSENIRTFAANYGLETTDIKQAAGPGAPAHGAARRPHGV